MRPPLWTGSHAVARQGNEGHEHVATTRRRAERRATGRFANKKARLFTGGPFSLSRYIHANEYVVGPASQAATTVTVLAVHLIRPTQENWTIYRKPDVTDPTFLDLVTSIRDNGINTPLEVSSDHCVLSGHRRLAAGREYGLPRRPFFVRSENHTNHAMKSHRPLLREIPLSSITVGPGTKFITLDVGAWDSLIADAWECGWILLEIEDERPVRAFQHDASAN